MNISDNECSREDIVTLLKAMKLTGMLASYDEIIADAVTSAKQPPPSICTSY